MTTSGEQVLVVPRSVVPDQGAWFGLRTDGLADFLERVPDHGRFEPRGAMELDPSHKQLIPYLVLRDGPAYFLMERTKAGGDARLHDHWSIGVGGHLNPGDADLFGGLRREWREELIADFEPAFEPLALLNDDTTDVGAVHLGVVFVADAAGRSVAVRETHKLRGRFAGASEVVAVVDRLESWSRLVFEALEGSGVGGPAMGPGR
jgi:predicted NUDIX family phosphoesterase